MKNPVKTPYRSGFTLIELLVSMVITTIIIASLVSITTISLDIWNRSRAEVRASLQGKAMIESMAADFESMVFRQGNSSQWLFAKAAPLEEAVGSETITSNSIDLIFFSAATDRYNGQIGEPEDLGGNVSTVAYQLAYKNPIGDVGNSGDEENFKTFILYREIVDPRETFDDLLGEPNLQTAFASRSTDIDATENFVCENIYQFTVTFNLEVVNDSNQTVTVPIQLDQDTAEEFILSGTGVDCPDPGIAGISAASLAAGRLTTVEVSLSVITDSGLAQLKGRGLTGRSLEAFLTKYSYNYSKVIPVPIY